MTYLDELIFRRRSVRKFKPDLPPGEWIENMVLCGARSPSPRNSQPVRFIRLESAPPREKLHDAMNDGRRHLLAQIEKTGGAKKIKNYVNSYFRFSEFMFEAPVLMCLGTLIEGGGRESIRQVGVELDDSGCRRRDLDITVGLAAKGYLLKGEELGLASCILTAPLLYISRPEYVLGLDDLDIRCFIVSGWRAEEPLLLERKSRAEIYRVL
jgi:nitroreductase